MATVEKSIDVNVPVRAAYNQWTQFEEFPEWTHGVTAVTQVDDTHLHWQAKAGSAVREWDAEIIEQIPETLIAWRATDGTPCSGLVRFEELGTDHTRVHLILETADQTWTDKVADVLGIVDGIVEADLERFRDYVEARAADVDAAAWRGRVHADLGAEDLSPPVPDVLGEAHVGDHLEPVP